MGAEVVEGPGGWASYMLFFFFLLVVVPEAPVSVLQRHGDDAAVKGPSLPAIWTGAIIE